MRAVLTPAQRSTLARLAGGMMEMPGMMPMMMSGMGDMHGMGTPQHHQD